MDTKVEKITVDNVKAHSFKSGLNQAQLRQVITRNYPSVKPNTGGLFAKSEFDLPEQSFQENRVTWVDVPTDKSVEDVQAQIDKFPDACIWKKLSSNVVMSEDDLALCDRILSADSKQIEKIVLNLTEQSEFSDSLRQEAVDAFIAKRTLSQQVVSKDGEIILHNNQPQYRRLFFSLEAHADEDDRIKSTSYSSTPLTRVSLQPEETVEEGVRTF